MLLSQSGELVLEQDIADCSVAEDKGVMCAVIVFKCGLNDLENRRNTSASCNMTNLFLGLNKSSAA